MNTLKVVSLLVCFVLVGSAHSQSISSASPPAVTMHAAFESAWQRAVSARESHGQRQRAEAERVAASSLWAAPPAIEAIHRDDRWRTNAGARETEIGLSWPLWLPGQRAARALAADTSISLASEAQAAARLRVASEVRESAWALIALQADDELADALVRLLTTLTDDVQRRVRAGDLARADALAARAELLNANAQQFEARQRVLSARNRWFVLTGLDAAPATDKGYAAEAAEPATHPELRLAAAMTELARKRLDVLRVTRRDPPELTLGARNEVPGRGESSQNSIVVGLRIPFGTADRNQPLQANALAELDVAETAEQRLRERFAADLTGARAASQAAEQQLAAERERSALLRERAQLIDKSFRAGESSLPDLLRALASAAQADASLARQQAALGLARARLQQALGLLP